MPTAAASQNLLLIAAREPVAGEVKTRLGDTIGMECAAVLYRAFLTDLARRFAPSDSDDDGFTLAWAFSPPTCDFERVIAALHPPAAGPGVRFVPQDGPDWGARQLKLLRWGGDHGFERTVLTASDSPRMTRAMVAQAFSALEDHDVVLGRVHDGGYYLVGTRGFHDVLSGVPMSTASAADAVIARAAALGLSITEVEPTFDIDTAADLVHLQRLCDENPGTAPATARAFMELRHPKSQVDRESATRRLIRTTG